MTELQQKLCDILEYFHNLCRENNLIYYVLGGTAIGCARHDGFIPWDDDIDVGMPREDYEKLKLICEKTSHPKYVVEYFGKAKDFTYPFGKIYDKTTTLIENNKYKTKRGIFIDIFPLDGAGNTKDEGLASYRKVSKKANLLYAKVCAFRKGRSFIKNLAVLMMKLVPNFILSPKKIFKKIDKLSKEKDYNSSNYVINYVGNWYEKELTLKEYFGTPKEYKFENLKVMGPEKIDEYLTGIYGNWRKLPPVEKQISHHDFILLDLNKSYLED